MASWSLTERDLKKYPHFDPPISAEAAQELATDPTIVAKHAFYPFIKFSQRWNRFSKKNEKGKKKERLIRYAARRDAYIYSYYRHMLSAKYEIELQRLELNKCVLAYRRIPVDDGTGGKCNIHFANDAFRKIQELGNCCVVALDISQFFESLDHDRLKHLWARMIGVDRLPQDHFKVFQAITRYAYVEKKNLYRRLGHFGEKGKSRSGVPIEGYLTHYRRIPIQLCKGKEFKEKIAGGGTEKTIIKQNRRPYGIPQGAPLSDLLANIYLIDFDCLMHKWTKASGGAYFRYSDDILLIAPGNEAEGRDLMARARAAITSFGSKLEIKEQKSSVYVFEKDSTTQTFRHIYGSQGRNGLEYLGFRFDGRRVYIRDSTLSNLRRKIARAARRQAVACAQRFPDKNFAGLKARFNYERLIKEFGRVENFGDGNHDVRNWTFWTYARRAATVFEAPGRPILRQLRSLRTQITHRANNELETAISRR